jgi:HPt (histidine-containing phosphotransfer) domain-containing protein
MLQISAAFGKTMLIIRALSLIAYLGLMLLPPMHTGLAAVRCDGIMPLQPSINMELPPHGECRFSSTEPKLVIFINYTANRQMPWLPQVDYLVNEKVLDLPTFKFYFVQLHAGDHLSFRNLTTRRTEVYYFAGAYWSLLIWAFCLITSTLGAAVAFAYFLLYRRMAYFHLAFFSLATALYNVLHPTAFTLNYVSFFVMASSYFNVVLGFQRPRWNRNILLATLTLATLWTLSFSAFPYDINIKISMISSLTGVMIIFLSAYNLWKRRRIIISSFALCNTVFIFHLGLVERQHLFAATFFQSIFICMMTFRLLQTAVANEKKARDAQEAIAFKNMELAQINQSLETRVLEQTADLRQQTGNLAILAQSSQRILENIEEGIICFTNDFKVEKVSSWAERELDVKAGDDILPFFSRIEAGDDHKAATVQSLILSMGADPIQWELNRGQFLQRVALGQRILHLSFHPIVLEQSVQSAILTVQDKTEEALLRDKEKKTDERFLRLMQKAKAIIQGGHVTRMFLQEVTPLLQNIGHLPDASPDQARLLLRQLHTIKGAARTAQFDDIATLVHHLETLYSEESLDLLRAGIESLQNALQEYALAIQEVFSHSEEAKDRRLLDAVQALKGNLERQLQAHGIRLAALTVTDALDSLPPGIQDCLMHAMTNVCDHGFILPLLRGAARKDAYLSIEGYCAETRAIIEIRDNGHGLNWDRIRDLCLQQQFVPERDRPLSDVLFLDGLSTADRVSMSSGRGVGLAYIHQVVTALPAGHVSLLDNDRGPGTLLRMEWEASPHERMKQAI